MRCLAGSLILLLALIQAGCGSRPVLDGALPEGAGDTLYLKNGRKLTGIIVKEGPPVVQIEVGFGRISVNSSEIRSVRRASEEQKSALRKRWALEQMNAATQKKSSEEERQRRLQMRYDDEIQSANTAKARIKAAEEAAAAKRRREAQQRVMEKTLEGPSKAGMYVGK